MTKKIKLYKRKDSWVPPPGEFDHIIPFAVVLIAYLLLVPILRSCG